MCPTWDVSLVSIIILKGPGEQGARRWHEHHQPTGRYKEARMRPQCNLEDNWACGGDGPRNVELHEPTCPVSDGATMSQTSQKWVVRLFCFWGRWKGASSSSAARNLSILKSRRSSCYLTISSIDVQPSMRYMAHKKFPVMLGKCNEKAFSLISTNSTLNSQGPKKLLSGWVLPKLDTTYGKENYIKI